jgi:protein-S-isoprenylcysteine O-methyltransferase Ste14
MSKYSCDKGGNVVSNFINLGSFLLLLIFGISYLLKLYMLRKRYNLKANVLANSNKSKKVQKVERTLQIATFIWLIAWIVEIAAVYLNIKNSLMLWNSYYVSIIGLVVIAIGVVFFIAAAVTMKNSWRVGIDKSTKSKLITEGIYKYSRNPAFVGFYLKFIGLFLVYSDIVTGVVMTVNIYAMHRLVLEEEKHLAEMFSKNYIVYKQKTPRYLFF